MVKVSHYITIDGIEYPYDNWDNEQHYAALSLMAKLGVDRARYRSRPFTKLEAEHEKAFPWSMVLFENTRYEHGTIVEILSADTTLMPDGKQCKYAGQLGTFVRWANGDGVSPLTLAQQVRDGRPLSGCIECEDGKTLVFKRHRFQIASKDGG